MNTVEPIRDAGTVQDIADYLMWMFGVYTAFRISDILRFRVRDVKNKRSIKLREKKTGNERKFIINKRLYRAIEHYIQDKPDYEYLFKSRQGENKPISRQQAYNIIREAAGKFGVEHVGTHTMRKTFGYHVYQKTKDAAMLMKIYNHSDIHITLRYIGIEQDYIDDTMAAFDIMY